TPYGNLNFRFIEKAALKFENNQNVAFIDYESLKEPLLIDLWQDGDKIQPLGMSGKKKISDILIDQKVSLPDKKRVMILKSGGENVWLIGHKFSDSFKIKEDTIKILRIEYENSESI
ncbi:MAG: tRNA(Ile)-lysidine synthetase, partial [Bacteroidetes bacterium]